METIVSRLPYVYDTYADEAEGETVEYKQTFHDTDKKVLDCYKKTICAFSNTNGGLLVFGVKDNGHVVGIQYNTKHMLDKPILKINEICRNMVPPVICKVDVYEILKDIYTLVIRIPKAATHVYHNHMIYQRINNANQLQKKVTLLTDEEYNDAMNRITNTKQSQQKLVIQLQQKVNVLQNNMNRTTKQLYDMILVNRVNKEKELMDQKTINCFSIVLTFFK